MRLFILRLFVLVETSVLASKLLPQTTRTFRKSTINADERRLQRNVGFFSRNEEETSDKSQGHLLRGTKATISRWHGSATSGGEKAQPHRQRHVQQQQPGCSLNSSGNFGSLQNQETHPVSFYYQAVFGSDTSDFEIDEDLLPLLEKSITEGILPYLFECPGISPKGPVSGISMTFPDLPTSSVPCLSSVAGKCQAFEGKMILFGNDVSGKAEAQEIANTVVRDFIVNSQGLSSSTLGDPRILDSLFVVSNNGVFARATAMPTMAPSLVPSTLAPTRILTQTPSTREPSEPPTGHPTVQPTNQPTLYPTGQPTSQPTILVSFAPTRTPTTTEPFPSTETSSEPSLSPTIASTSKPLSVETLTPQTTRTSTPQTVLSKAPTVTPTLAPSAAQSSSIDDSSLSSDGDQLAWRTLFLISFGVLLFILLSLLFCFLYRFHEKFAPNPDGGKKSDDVVAECPTGDASPHSEVRVPLEAALPSQHNLVRADSGVVEQTAQKVSETSSLMGRIVTGEPSPKGDAGSRSSRRSRRTNGSDHSSLTRPSIPDKFPDSPSEASTLNSYIPLENDEPEDYKDEPVNDDHPDRFVRVTDKQVPHYNDDDEDVKDLGATSTEKTGDMPRVYDFREPIGDPCFDPNASFDSLPPALLKGPDERHQPNSIEELDLMDSYQSLSQSLLKGSDRESDSFSFYYENGSDLPEESSRTLPRSLLKGPNPNYQVRDISELNGLDSPNTVPPTLLKGSSAAHQICGIDDVDTPLSLPKSLLNDPSELPQRELDEMSSIQSMSMQSMSSGQSTPKEKENSEIHSPVNYSSSVSPAVRPLAIVTESGTRHDELGPRQDEIGSEGHLSITSMPLTALNQEGEAHEYFCDNSSSSSESLRPALSATTGKTSSGTDQNSNSHNTMSSSHTSWNSNLIVARKENDMYRKNYASNDNFREEEEEESDNENGSEYTGQDEKSQSVDALLNEDSYVHSGEDDPLIALESLGDTSFEGMNGQDSREQDSLIEINTLDGSGATSDNTTRHQNALELSNDSLPGSKSSRVMSPHIRSLASASQDDYDSPESSDSTYASSTPPGSAYDYLEDADSGSDGEGLEEYKKQEKPNSNEHLGYLYSNHGKNKERDDTDSYSYEELTVYTEATAVRSMSTSNHRRRMKSDEKDGAPISGESDVTTQEDENEVEIQVVEDDSETTDLEQSTTEEKDGHTELIPGLDQPNIDDFMKSILSPDVALFSVHGITETREGTEQELSPKISDTLSKESTVNKELHNLQSELSVLRNQVSEMRKLQQEATKLRKERDIYYLQMSDLEREIKHKDASKTQHPEDIATILHLLEENESLLEEMMDLKRQMQTLELHVSGANKSQLGKEGHDAPHTVGPQRDSNVGQSEDGIDLDGASDTFNGNHTADSTSYKMKEYKNTVVETSSNNSGHDREKTSLEIDNHIVVDPNSSNSGHASASTPLNVQRGFVVDKSSNSTGHERETRSLEVEYDIVVDTTSNNSVSARASTPHDVERDVLVDTSSNNTGHERKTPCQEIDHNENERNSNIPISCNKTENDPKRSAGDISHASRILQNKDNEDNPEIDKYHAWPTPELPSRDIQRGEKSETSHDNSEIDPKISTNDVGHGSEMPSRSDKLDRSSEILSSKSESEKTSDREPSDFSVDRASHVVVVDERLRDGTDSYDECTCHDDDGDLATTTSDSIMAAIVREEMGGGDTSSVAGSSLHSTHANPSNPIGSTSINPGPEQDNSDSYEEETLPDEFHPEDACITQEELMKRVHAHRNYETPEERSDDDQSYDEVEDSLVDYALHTIEEEDEEDSTGGDLEISKDFSFFSDNSDNEESMFSTSINTLLISELQTRLDRSNSEASIEEWNAIEEYPRLLDPDGDDSSKGDSYDNNIFSSVLASRVEKGGSPEQHQVASVPSQGDTKSDESRALSSIQTPETLQERNPEFISFSQKTNTEAVSAASQHESSSRDSDIKPETAYASAHERADASKHNTTDAFKHNTEASKHNTAASAHNTADASAHNTADEPEHVCCNTCGLDCTVVSEATTCSECRDVYYCSPECAKWDWEKGGHAKDCSRKYSKSKKSPKRKGILNHDVKEATDSNIKERKQRPKLQVLDKPINSVDDTVKIEKSEISDQDQAKAGTPVDENHSASAANTERINPTNVRKESHKYSSNLDKILPGQGKVSTDTVGAIHKSQSIEEDEADPVQKLVEETQKYNLDVSSHPSQASAEVNLGSALTHDGATWLSDESSHLPRTRGAGHLFVELSSDEEERDNLGGGRYVETHSDASSASTSPSLPQSIRQSELDRGKVNLASREDLYSEDGDASSVATGYDSSGGSHTTGPPMPTGEGTEEGHEDDWE